MSWLSRLNRPWLHFIVLGFVLFELQRMAFPAPKPVVGPLSEARVETLEQQWLAATGRPPTAAQSQRLIAQELDRDMLFQRALELDLHLYDQVVYQRLLRNMHFLQLAEGKSEQELYDQALEMRLHLGDEVIKRRMIQVMEQLLLAANPPAPVTGEDIAASFAERREELRRAPRYSIEQLYFNRQREGEIPAVIDTIAERGLDAAAARTMSSPFLPGYQFTRQTPDQLARNFGSTFVMNLQQAEPRPRSWVGPIRSTYGLHYVWVEDIEPARDATLAEVRPRLLRDLESRQRADALAGAIDKLRQQYEVRL
ncbi:peptidylprolyl isomerase [Parahaliea mediterranea]|uniref:Peptidyl-prolyl cis-trans isomerase n=1 Tax=Parahaliea mediterranea TaxID=651086 RepID=A0A939DGY9_9GAMM|nr:peptidylprolyl isomerase [Parahaliea mediterranea]MBN7798006.1 peptidyl-prolyl cis-trans isomerase [Parahaliea mediterranea]